MLSCFHSFSDYSLTPGFGFVKVLFGSFWFILVHPSKIGVPSSIMRKFVYKSGRTPSAQGRGTCPWLPNSRRQSERQGRRSRLQSPWRELWFLLSTSFVLLHLKVLHAHVLFPAPLGSDDMTQSGAYQHQPQLEKVARKRWSGRRWLRPSQILCKPPK